MMKTAEPAGARQGLKNTSIVLFWLLAGTLLRVWQSGWYPLREDEALYSTWARLISSGRDVMLERVAVDKPPFFLYALARWFDWFGPSDAAGRSLNLLIAVLTMLLVWQLARRLFGPRAGRWTLAFFALSPFAISFAPTVYTDPMLTAWIVLALLAASWRLGLLAGLALGMAFATKQNALLFIPLILLALPLGRWPDVIQSHYAALCNRWQTFHPLRYRLAEVGYWLLPLVMAALGFGFLWHKVWQWDSWRILPAEIPDFWTQSWHSYGGLALTPPAQWPARLAEWWQVWRWWGGGMVGTLLIAGLSLVAIMAALRQVKSDQLRAPAQSTIHNPQYGIRNTEYAIRNTQYWILLFAAFSLLYLALHVLLDFQAWDRYLLPLAPLGAMLAALGALELWQRARDWRPMWRRVGAAVVALTLLLGAGRAASARIPIGGDHGAYSGLIQVADFLRENTPAYHGVVYQRWLGWQWGWYLWDGPPREYWADASMLAQDVAKDRYGYTRFVVFPAWHLDEKPALDEALAGLGLHLEERLQIKNERTGEPAFIIYEIEPHIRSRTIQK